MQDQLPKLYGSFVDSIHGHDSNFSIHSGGIYPLEGFLFNPVNNAVVEIRVIQ